MFVLLPSFLAAPSLAADPVFGAANTAMGETGVADPFDNVAITLNPGMLALTERYDFAGSFSFGPQEGLHWSTSAMDARTSDYMAAGVVYAGDSANPPLTPDDMPGWVAEDEEVENLRRNHDFTGSFSIPIAKRRVGFGMGFTVGFYNFDRHGSGWTLDAMAGVGVRATDWLTFGSSVRNFVPGPNAQDRDPDARLGARAEVATQFAVEADLVMYAVDDRLPVGFGAGGELMISAARIRAGYKLDEDHVSNVALGLGWDGDGASIDFGFLSPVPRFDLQEVIYQVSMRFGAAEPMPEEEPF